MVAMARPAPEFSGVTESMFLATKIAAPRESTRWVQRPRLLSRLGVPAQARVILVHAGAGFGKTALLAQWQHDLTRAGISAAWLSVDSRDDNIHLFIAYLAAAINRVCPEVGRDVIDLITRSGQLVPPATLLVPLANAIAEYKAPLVLIVDDFHFLASSEIQDWMMEFVSRAPENLSIAIGARSFPPRRLSRLRATEQVEEIGPDDLALTFGEVQQYMLAATEVMLTAGEIGTLHERTEGWAAGLQMVTIALRGKRNVGNPIESFNGAARAVSGYLQEEVFATLPAELRGFLMRSAILDRFCADVCMAVTGVPDAANLIAEIERRELFVLPLDGEGRWYRYHHLFVDFLIAELIRRYPDELPGLHARASQWFAAHGQWREAVHHAIEAGDYAHAVDVANRCAMNLVRDGDYFVLQTLLARLPENLHRKSVTLRLAEAWVLALNGQGGAVDGILRGLDAESDPATAADAFEPETRAIRVTLAYVQDDSERITKLLRDTRGVGDGSQPWVVDVLKCAASVDHIWHRRFADARDFYPCTTVFKRVYQLVLFGWSWWYQGRVAEAEANWHAAADFADGESGARSLPALMPRILLARIDYENGRFDNVERALAGRISVLEQVCTTDLMATATYALAWSRAARGRTADAIALFDRMRLLAAERGWVRMEASAIIELLRLTFSRQPDQAAHLAQRLRTIGPTIARKAFSTHWVGARLCQLGAAFHRAMTSVGDESTRALEAIARDICDLAPPPDGVTATLLLAQALHAHGDRTRALEAIARALKLAQGLGIARTFVDSGEWALSLVREIRASGARRPAELGDEYLDRLLRLAQSDSQPSVALPLPASGAAMIESLTRRERDILTLVGRGLSNKEIGRSLQIGPETVKWHLKNTFGKLGVATRFQATRRAQALALPI
jgi:LuxR family transcriptional regulator, maltose regulon positive regulatory protein